jgi:hypothetical protein
MQHRKRGAETQQSFEPIDEHCGSESAAAARLQDQDQARKDYGIGSKQPGERWAERAACKRGRDYEHRYEQGTQRQIKTRPWACCGRDRHRKSPQAAHSKCETAGKEHASLRKRPCVQLKKKRCAKPGECRQGKRSGGGKALRRERMGGDEGNNCDGARDACHRGPRDERRAMVHREKDVDRAGRDGQRGDHRPEERPGSLCEARGGNHDHYGAGDLCRKRCEIQLLHAAAPTWRNPLQLYRMRKALKTGGRSNARNAPAG